MTTTLIQAMKPAGKKTKATESVFALVLLVAALHGFGQTEDTTSINQINQKRFQPLVISTGAGYTGGMVALSRLWYGDSDRGSFRFFNDNAEWKQLDKAGHFFTAYHLSQATSRGLRWSNVSPRKADLAGSLTGFLLLLPIEVLDGYASAYGASAGDLLANAGGALFFLGQQRWWNEQRILLKFSFTRTPYAPLRPEVLGDGALQELFKDYNGQTYWLSTDMDKFVRFPKWLNIAVGYGADGMVYGRDYANAAAGHKSHRQYYLSLDPDLSAIKTRSRLVKTLIFIAGMVKIPAPTISLEQGRVKFHAFYF